MVRTLTAATLPERQIAVGIVRARERGALSDDRAIDVGAAVGSKSQIIGRREQGLGLRAVYMMFTGPSFHPLAAQLQDNGTRISRATIIDDLPAPEGDHGEVARADPARNRYRPELHYMRGPGPKWYAKHQGHT